MRRIMADTVALGSMILTRTEEDQKTLRLPEPNSANVGKTGLFGYGDFIASVQAMEIEISRTGGFTYKAQYIQTTDGMGGSSEGWGPEHGQFVFTPDSLEITAADIMDALNPLGKEYHYSIRNVWNVADPEETDELTSPKLIPLRYQKYTEAAGRVCGMAVYTTHDGATAATTKIYTMKNVDPTVADAFEWAIKSPSVFGGAAVSSSVPASVDVTEMDDGTIYMVLGYDKYFRIYLTRDSGAKWYYVSTTKTHASVATETFYCIEHIGERLVVVASYLESGNIKMKSCVSDDFGMSFGAYGTILDHADDPTAPYINTCMGVGGEIILSSLIEDTAEDRARSYTSLDGENWSAVNTMYGNEVATSHAIVKTFNDGFIGYYLSTNNEVNSQVFNVVDANLADEIMSLTPETTDGSATFVQLDAAEFNDGGFIDIMVTAYNAPGAMYCVFIMRAAMWSGLTPVPYDGAYYSIYEYVWLPHCYPNSAEPHPNTDMWEKTVAGGVAALQYSEGIELDSDGVAANNYYYYHDSTKIPADSYTNGIMMRFALKVDSGCAKVHIILDDNTAKKVDGYVLFDQSDNRITVYDTSDASVVMSSIVNWNVDEWNDYIVVAKGNIIQVYRSPLEGYGEIAPFELVVDGAVTDIASVESTDQLVEWGIKGTSPTNVEDTVCYFKYFYIQEHGDVGLTDWAFSTAVMRGGRSHFNPLGIMQGIQAAFDGDLVLDGDKWELDTGAVYEFDNLFVHSPTIRWQEPEQSGASAEQVLTWQRPDDGDSEVMYFEYNAVALFGRNFMDFDLKGSNNLSAWTSLIDTATQKGYIREWVLSAVSKNMVTVTKGAASERDMVPNQFASTSDRKYYVKFTDNVLSGKIYKIIGNTATQLFLEVNVDDAGAAVSDTVRLFGDSIFYEAASLQRFRYLRLTIDATTTSPSEKQLRLGTIVVGRTYGLPDDEWTAGFDVLPSIEMLEGRGGLVAVNNLGKSRRELTLSYTGITDEGMGVNAVSKLGEFIRWGQYPIVWLDHDLQLDTANMCHHEPILVRLTSPMKQSRVAYNYLADYMSNEALTLIKNILDTGTLEFQEVI